MKVCMIVVCTALLTMFLPVVALTQSKGIIEGRIIDQRTGQALVGVNVTLQGTVLGAATDRQGFYRISQVPPGRYTVRASMMGYKAELVKGIEVKEEENVVVDFALETQAFLLDEIVITATRTEKLLKEVPVTTELITREDIEESGAEDISEILEERVGIRVRKSEGHGWGIQMQGLDARYVLILVDGEEVIGRTAGLVDLRQIPIESIERIEVVKGASSSLYGSEAVGGVVNIITKTASVPFGVAFTTTFGSYNKRDPRASVELKREGFRVYLTASRNVADGFDMDKSDVAQDGSPYRKTAVTGKLVYDLSPAAKLMLSSRFYGEQYTPVRISRGNIFDTVAQEKRVNGSLSLAWKPDKTSNLLIKVYGTDYDRDINRLFRNIDRRETAFERENQIRGEVVYTRPLWRKHLVTAGVDAFWESLEAEETSTASNAVNRTPKRSENTKVFYLQDEIQLARPLTLVVGGRLDNHSAFGSRFSPKVNLHYRIGKHLDFRGSYGSGFRAPSIRDLYRTFINFAHGYQVLGNSTLRPETSGSINLGLSFRWKEKFLGRINVFRNDLNNAIKANFVGTRGNLRTYVYQNISQSFTTGAETEIQASFATNVSISVSHAYVWSNDKATGKELLGVSRNTADWKLEFDDKDFGFNANIRGEYDSGWLFLSGPRSNPKVERSPAYVTWDIWLSQKLTRYFKVRFGIDNIFDRKERNFEPRPGREIYGGFSLSF